jgi:hypothetical protein
MHPNSSSTSSSDGPAKPGPRGALATLGAMLLCLIAADLLVGVVAGTPYGRGAAQVNQLTRYFDYGRSIEGKVLAMAGADGTDPHPLAQTGWIAPPAGQPERLGQGQDLLVAVYGMSFAANIAKHMQAEDKKIAVRFGGGPGAPLSHSYALYTADRNHHEANVVVLGILASSLPALVTTTHMTWNFEAPSPHFYPRYSVVDGKLIQYLSSVGSLSGLQTTIRNPPRWRALVAEIAAHDEFYDPFVFGSWSVDGSVLARLVRRGWGQRIKRGTIERFHNAGGFTNELGLIDVTHALVNAFVSQVRSDGKLPVVMAINDRGYADHLHRVLAPIVAADRAVYMSTHELAPASESANFVKDGHFIATKDQLMGRKLIESINSRLDRK